MPFSPLAPDYRDRLAQQVPTGTVDPSLPTVTTPVGSTSPLSTGQTQPSLTSQAQDQSRYGSYNEIPEVKLEDFQKKGERGWLTKHLPANGILQQFESGASKPTFTPKTIDRYLKAKLDRLSNVAMMAGIPKNERAALRQTLRAQIANPTLVQSSLPKGADPANLSDEQRVALIDTLVSGKENTLMQPAIAANTGATLSTQDPTAVEYSPEQIAMLQASAASYMKPYTDDLAKRGMSDIAAAYMNQARTAPLISAAQERDQLAKQVQTLQNQRDSYLQGSTTSDADFGTMLAQLTGGG